MSVVKFEIRRGTYCDSVLLMQLQRDLSSVRGVLDAGVVMATPANLALLAESDLLPRESQVSPDDLLIVVRAEGDEAASLALIKVDEFMAGRRRGVQNEYRPRSIDGALKTLPETSWVVISVPGKYAAEIASQSLQVNRHVFLYSDNVSLEDEIELKKAARTKGLLVLGPECGTAIVNGIGLGFANRVRRGRIGLVGASGTGLQAVAVQIHSMGEGVSHALGTGGRDLSAKVGGITTGQCFDLLARDPQTSVIVLVSKPPDTEIAARVLAIAQSLDKPVVVNLLAYPPPARRMGNLHFALNLKEAAELATNLLKEFEAAPASHSPDMEEGVLHKPRPTGYLRGLFSGGTLATDAMLGLRAMLHPLYSNTPLPGVQRLSNAASSQAHTIVDLGAEEFTLGRLHPMIDYEVRLRRLRQEADDAEAGMILLDVVLGDGAHPDPSFELAPAIGEITRRRNLEVVVILVGSEDDPQDINVQQERLENAGAKVFRGMDEAIVYLRKLLSSTPEFPQPPVSLETLYSPVAAINVGLESFYQSLRSQGVPAVQVDWRPPAGGNERLMSILEKMKP